jgi:hypothetical protein
LPQHAAVSRTIEGLAVEADAAGIAYAVVSDWLIISGGLHSVSLTEAGRALGYRRTGQDSIL